MTVLNFGGAEQGTATPVDAIASAAAALAVTSGGGVPRTGTYAYRNATSGTAKNSSFAGLSASGRPAELARTAQTFYSFWFKPVSFAGSTYNICRIISSAGTEVVRIDCSSAGVITLVGTSTSSTVATLSTGSYYEFRLRVTSNGVSGLIVGAGAEQTITANNVTQDRIMFGTTSAVTQDSYYDDWVIDDAESIKDARVYMGVAIGEGGDSTTEWHLGTGNTFAVVDEIPNNTSDYLEPDTSTTNVARRFAMTTAATLGLANAIKAVRPQITLVEPVSATTQAGVAWRSGATASNTTSADVGSTTYVEFATILATDPDTSAAWTSAGFDGIEVGPWKGADNSAIRCSAVYVGVLTASDPLIPPTAALTLSSFAPTVTATNNTLATPGVATLTLSTFAPVVGGPVAFTPGTLALTLAGFAPTVALNLTITPGALALVIATFAPVVSTPLLVTPPTLALTLASFAPVISTPRLVTPPTASLVLSGFAPVVSTPQTFTPDTLALVLATFAPSITVSADRVVTPDTLALVLTPFAPTAATPQTITPGAAALALTAFAPSVSTPILATPGTLALVLSAFAPLITASDHQLATPGTRALILTGFAPVAATPTVATPGALALVLSTFAPGVVTPVLATPGALALALTAFAPAPAVSDNRTVTPGAAALVIVTFDPSVRYGLVYTPGTAALVLTMFRPDVRRQIAGALAIIAQWDPYVRAPGTWAPVVELPAEWDPFGRLRATWAPIIAKPAEWAPTESITRR